MRSDIKYAVIYPLNIYIYIYIYISISYILQQDTGIKEDRARIIKLKFPLALTPIGLAARIGLPMSVLLHLSLLTR